MQLTCMFEKENEHFYSFFFLEHAGELRIIVFIGEEKV